MNDFHGILPPPMADSATMRARRRIRDEMELLHLNQADVAGRIQWTQSKVSKVLSGRIGLDVDDLEALCFAVGISMTEAVRDRGLEFCAEMTPAEMRLLEQFRKLDTVTRDGVLGLLHARTFLEQRGATKPKDRLKKLR